RRERAPRVGTGVIEGMKMAARIRHVHLGSRDIKGVHLPGYDILRFANAYHHGLHLRISRESRGSQPPCPELYGPPFGGRASNRLQVLDQLFPCKSDWRKHEEAVVELRPQHCNASTGNSHATLR